MDTDRIEAGTFAVAAAITRRRSVHPRRGGGACRSRSRASWSRPARMSGSTMTASRARAQGPHAAGGQDQRQPASRLPDRHAAAVRRPADPGGGTSVITETVYERRFRYIDELARMGADIKTEANAAIIVGVPAPDRARRWPARTCARRRRWCWRGWPPKGRPKISGIKYLDRGYEDFVRKLRRRRRGDPARRK